MADEKDRRRGDRFALTQQLNGTFAGEEVSFENLSLGGAHILHAAPLRIGTRGRLTFKTTDTAVSTPARILWSRLSQSGGAFLYRSGVGLDAADPQYALALNELIRNGWAVLDAETMERKRLREREMEERRRSGPVAILTLPPQTE